MVNTPESGCFKMLTHPRPSLVLCEMLAGNEVISLPQYFQQADRVPAGPSPWHNGSVLAHLSDNMDAMAGDPLAVWMALAHDLGKLTTPEDLWPHHYGHEERGVELAQELGRHLGLPQNYIEAGMLAVRLHMRAGRYKLLRPGKKRDLLMEVEEAGLTDSFWKFVDADKGESISSLARRDLAEILSIKSYYPDQERWRQSQISRLVEGK